MEIKLVPLSELQPTSWVITSEDAGQRLDRFIAQSLKQYSRTFIQDLIEKGQVVVNNSYAKASTILKVADVIEVQMPLREQKQLFQPVDTNLGIEVVAEHEHFFVINKPAKLLVHQTQAGTSEPTVVDWLVSSHQELKDIGQQERPGIVHRLDKDTSGLLLIARTNFAHLQFNALFKNRAITKKYLAIVQGHPPASGTIDLSIVRDPIHRKKMMAVAVPDAVLSTTKAQPRGSKSNYRSALTHYRVKQYFADHALVEVHPVTGRTHQIRVHFAAIGHPLLGDSHYGQPSKLLDRHALHAYSLSFTFAQSSFSFVKEVPEDLQKVIAILQNS